MILKLALLLFSLHLAQAFDTTGHRHVVKLPECEACEKLVESFLKGIERTEKSNHAGGNTAWEESQLGAYATSELRFIEIQETLCRDNATTMPQCQTLAEELEDHLEKWWVQDRWEVPDLRHYLCVKKAKVCFPKLTSSVAPPPPEPPSPAPEGSKCPDGYLLRPPDECEDVDECRSLPCGRDELCVNTKGSYRCEFCHPECLECYGPGPYKCKVFRNPLKNLISALKSFQHLFTILPTAVFVSSVAFLCVRFVFQVPLLPFACVWFLIVSLVVNILKGIEPGQN